VLSGAWLVYSEVDSQATFGSDRSKVAIGPGGSIHVVTTVDLMLWWAPAFVISGTAVGRNLAGGEDVPAAADRSISGDTGQAVLLSGRDGHPL